MKIQELSILSIEFRAENIFFAVSAIDFIYLVVYSSLLRNFFSDYQIFKATKNRYFKKLNRDLADAPLIL